MPTPRYAEPVPTPLVIGHRGAPGRRPEHTRSSYTLALEAGADAVEPDVVVSRDGVLVVRHENEVSTTTDVARHPEFADRRTTKPVDGRPVTGWFTEDFTWDELTTLRARERLPRLRPDNVAFDGHEPLLRLRDVLDLVRVAAAAQRRDIGVVVEIKHATTLGSLGFDMARLVAAELREAGWADGGMPLTVESFESTALDAVRARGVHASYVYLLEASGSPFDLVTRDHSAAPTYAQQVAPAGLDALARRFDGISVDKKMILAPDRLGRTHGPSRVITDAHDRGLRVLTWTCRPENAFLVRQFRRGGEDAAFGDYPGEWGMLRDAGVDGVFVDHPDLGVAFFHHRSPGR